MIEPGQIRYAQLGGARLIVEIIGRSSVPGHWNCRDLERETTIVLDEENLEAEVLPKS